MTHISTQSDAAGLCYMRSNLFAVHHAMYVELTNEYVGLVLTPSHCHGRIRSVEETDQIPDPDVRRTPTCFSGCREEQTTNVEVRQNLFYHWEARHIVHRDQIAASRTRPHQLDAIAEYLVRDIPGRIRCTLVNQVVEIFRFS
jgi:hypothetical protein